MSDYPERISISPVHRQKHDDDFYLVDRKAFPGKGTEYVRADRIEELEAKLAIAWDTQTVKILIKTAYKEGWADGGDNVPLGSGWEKSRTKAILADLTGGEKDGN